MNDYDDDDDGDHYDWSFPRHESRALVLRSTKGAFFKRNNINRPFDLFTKTPLTRVSDTIEIKVMNLKRCIVGVCMCMCVFLNVCGAE